MLLCIKSNNKKGGGGGCQHFMAQGSLKTVANIMFIREAHLESYFLLVWLINYSSMSVICEL